MAFNCTMDSRCLRIDKGPHAHHPSLPLSSNASVLPSVGSLAAFRSDPGFSDFRRKARSLGLPRVFSSCAIAVVGIWGNAKTEGGGEYAVAYKCLFV